MPLDLINEIVFSISISLVDPVEIIIGISVFTTSLRRRKLDDSNEEILINLSPFFIAKFKESLQKIDVNISIFFFL